MKKTPAMKAMVLTPDSDPADIIAIITALVKQLGTTMLTDVAMHSAQLNGTTTEDEFKKFSARVDDVANHLQDAAEKIYVDNDEMLGTMVLASILHSVRMMTVFVDECNSLREDEENEHDSLCVNATEEDGFDVDVPEGMGMSLNGGKYEH